MDEMLSAVNQTVAGLEDSKRRILVALRNHMFAALHGRPYRVANLFVLGQTGGGKTHLLRACLEATGLPYVEVNATVYSETGYAGLDLSTMFLGLEEDYDSKLGVHRKEYRKLLERWGVVLIDEMDKWHYTPNPKERQVGRALQSEMLRYAEGDTAYVRRSDHENGYPFNTHHILFIGMGAFEDIDKYVRDEFQNIENKREIMAKVKPEHIIRYGFMEELVGRFSTIVALPPLSTKAMERVFLEQVWPRWEQKAQDEGLTLTADPSALHDIANIAAQDRIGARALEPLLSNITWRAWSHAKPGDTIHIDSAAVAYGEIGRGGLVAV